ncbi:proteasome stabiliser-domain-containing protein [Apiosordaria backusii]|uniref:Proteasome stabiliser-domain-containing protein n=1 Tax=Apiosordaria backusii TaxID=314023 RepID=A0AA40EZW3_9PEZI|nr:proteasome stabiliser-domain-containing protein [Apiosordaria backusii]
MPPPTEEEKQEISLLDRAEWTILSASSDERKLQEKLRVYLCPVLLKAGSPHVRVRNKVISVCGNINKLIQSPTIVLPVASLLDQFKQTDYPLIKHFDLIYIQHSVARLERHEQQQLVPKALRDIRTGPKASLSQLFNVILRLLPTVKIPSRGSQEDAGFREAMGLSHPEDAKFVAEWLGKLLLLPANASTEKPAPGLTEGDISFLTLAGKKDTWNPSAGGLNLPETRILAANFLASGAFTDEERFIPALYAAASTDYRISGVGEDQLKRTSVSLENKALVQKLFDAHSKLQPPYRIRILGMLSKSEIATTFTDEVLAVFRRNVDLKSQNGAQDATFMDIDQRPSAPKSSGLEQTKLHRALFEFINWVARIGPSKTDFNKIGVNLVGMLKEFVQSQGWPKPLRQSLDDSVLRSRAYETIGILAKGTKMDDHGRLGLAAWLFRSLSEDPTPDVVVNIDGALSSVAALFKPPHNFKVSVELQSILVSYMLLEDEADEGLVRSTRHAVAKWANNCLPFSDVQARWIDIVAVAGRLDERNDVVEEGHKGLDPWTYHANEDENKSKDLPDWQEMVESFFKASLVPLKSKVEGGMEIDIHPLFKNYPGDMIHAFPVALDYCRKILFLTALADNFTFDAGWQQRMEALVQSDLVSRKAIRNYLSQFTYKEQPFGALLSAAFEGMVRQDAPKIVESCARTFVDLASFAPKTVLAFLASRSEELLPLIKSNRKELRALGSKAFGILAAHPVNSAAALEKVTVGLVEITKGLKTAVGAELNAVEGSLLALAHLASRLVYYSGAGSGDRAREVALVFPTLEDVASATSIVSTQETLFEAWSQLWTAGLGSKQDQGSLVKAFVDPLVLYAKKGNEKAIAALGRLALSLPSDGSWDETLEKILGQLYALHELKQVEVHFAVGEAIAAAVARWDAEVVQLTVDVETVVDGYWAPRRTAQLTAVLEKLLADCKTTKPSLLKASGIWLFCLIQRCSHLEEVQSRLRLCQVAFMRLLSARDELVQETASRGLALVYEKGDAGLKSDLTKDLVASFTGSGPQIKVEEETELFEAGALPTGDGKSITSYKDIVSLANEVGDPSLVYKFMSLATNAATWSTRSAFGRFGLSNILSNSEVDPKLYPKLYRYRFDPNTNVQRSMNDIWKALVQDPNVVLETQFDNIMTDLLKSILGREWRVREASCSAIAELISGRPFPKYEKYYKDIWAAAVKVADDVKATVRNAAGKLCMALSTTLVRQLEDSGSSATAKSMMNEALPFLLSDKGIESSADEVKYFCVGTVLKIAKRGGSSLKPYIPTMVAHLLGLLSTIEPEAINYYYQRVGEANRDKLDKLRANAVSQGPIGEAIEDCLRNVDAEVMEQLVPKLSETIKTAIGMPTKIGCGRAIWTLSTRHGINFEKHAPAFLNLMEKHTLDRNDEVSQGYARATAYLLRVAPDVAKQRFIEKFIKLYLESDTEVRRQKVADVVLALSKVSPDHFNALETLLLPFAFLGKHDTDEYTQKAFKEVWDTHAGTHLTVTKYLKEIVSLAEKTLSTAQWALKHGGALTVADAAESVAGATTVTHHVNVEHVKILWPVYDKALLLKTFPGKEKLLEPFPKFVELSKDLLEKDANLAAAYKKVAIREAKRNNDVYRPHAFECLWRVAAAWDGYGDMLPEIKTIVAPYLEIEDESKDTDAMDVDIPASSSKGSRGLDLKTVTKWKALEALAKGYNPSKMKKEPTRTLREFILAVESIDPKFKPVQLFTTKPYITRPEFDTIRKTYWYECAKDLLQAAAAVEGASSPGSDHEESFKIIRWFLSTLDLDAEDTGLEAQRVARARAVKSAVQVGKTAVEGFEKTELGKEIEGLVKGAIEKERSLDVQKEWRECLKVLG